MTPEQFATALRWLHVPGWIIVLTLIAFVRLYLQAGRRWLAWTVYALRTLSLLFNFLVGQNLNYREVTRLRHIPFFGESVAVGEGVSNPLMLIGQLSLLLFVIFVADAAITVWRRGNRQLALVTGGSIVFFALAGTVQTILVLWQIVQWPYAPSLCYLGIVVVMSFEMIRDVLQAAQLSDDLHESERRLALAADSAGVGLWSWDFKTNLLWATERSRILYGFSSDELLTFEKFLSKLHPGDLDWVVDASQKCLQEGADFGHEYRIVLPDGSIRWIKVLAKAFSAPSGKPLRMTGVSIDITERKRAEQDFRQVVEASPSGIVLVNREGRILLVNVETEKLFGYPREELIGHPVEMLLPERFRDEHPSHRAGFFAAPQPRTLSAGRELFALSRDGTEFPVEIRLNPIQSADGVLVLTAILDITARKQAEAETMRQRNELAHVARISTMGYLASSLAHELNQSLGAILRNAEAAELFLADPSSNLEEVRDILRDIREDDQRAGEVIDRMRALMKRGELTPTSLNIAEVVAEIMPLIHPDAVSRRMRLKAEVPGNLPRVRGDRVQLQQVLLNLILNGMDAMEEVPAGARRLIVRARQADAETIEVAVADAGHGVPDEKFTRLFEPFFTTKPNGMGLGLPISSTIIAAHGGRIWAENSPAGATFFFTVPVTTEKPAS